MTADIIDIKTKFKDISEETKEKVNLALLSVFYFIDEFNDKVNHLDDEIKYAILNVI